MEEIYMVRVESKLLKEDMTETENHGAFKSYRGASQFAIDEGYEAFYDDELSELLDEESISFFKSDERNGEISHAFIDSYALHD